MSWRTQSHYRGLSDKEKDWLKEFDRKWDTKALGRSRTDAFEYMGESELSSSTIQPKSHQMTPRINTISARSPEYGRFEDSHIEISCRVAMEGLLIKVAANIARFTVPRQNKSGWSIHIIMKDGKRIRARFPDLGAALQAHNVLEEYSLWFIAS
jgi:hypothetical protein